jgi:DNA-binding LytR/AlgR family response regulator
MVQTPAMRLRVLIVDDEAIARRVLREELDLLEGTEVVGEADSGVLALEMIGSLEPDLVLLDLQMPGMGGFEVVRALERGKHLPIVVIVTAYDQYAIQAFEAGALDYLLKPVREDRLARSIERARMLRPGTTEVARNLAQLHEIADDRRGSSPKRKIVAKAGEEYLLLDADEVFAFEADGDLVWIITATKRYLATQNLRSLQERLRNTSFRRVHRSALVNMDHVRKLSALSSQRWLIKLSNNLEFIVSKRLAHNVRQFLTW